MIFGEVVTDFGADDEVLADGIFRQRMDGEARGDFPGVGGGDAGGIEREGDAGVGVHPFGAEVGGDVVAAIVLGVEGEAVVVTIGMGETGGGETVEAAVVVVEAFGGEFEFFSGLEDGDGVEGVKS